MSTGAARRPPVRRPTGWVLAALVIALAAVVVLVAAQLLLPGIAAGRLRDRLGRDGTVTHVDVSAFPAVKLLWGRADDVHVHLASLHVTQARTGDLLDQARKAGTAEIVIDRFTQGVLTLHDVRATKRGSAVSATATLANADLQRALPPGLSVSPVSSGGGQLVLRASANVFGVGLGIDTVVSAVNGALVAQPNLPVVGSIASLTLFSDPRVAVQAVGASPSAGGYGLTASAQLTGG